ncbi:MAG: bifunctional DNA-formamidopyrimidine glycosylase/DNA-(apurinic or apyrimidinic site) lyase [Victivallaceae bacterium]|nr:bifunctional DNA-formamidopyrimidine glycosylase/DNA-(apurinic or apyrimidinic site) lyase [Victivallaceae bacterium]
MPELPEVETITAALRPHLTGRRFTRIETHIASVRYPLAPLNDAALLGYEIISVRRRARYIIIELDNRRTFIIHLGMSGSLRVVPAPSERRKHEHVVWHLDDGMTLRFDCPRRFGFVKTAVLAAAGAKPAELNGLGLEPLSPEFNADWLYRVSRGRRGPIKSLIMNNALVVGVGNIYAAEALFKSRINPFRAAMNLTRKQCAALVAAVREILTDSIRIGGTTIATYKSLDGSEGKFVQYLQIYGKDGQNCPVCGTSIQRKRLAGRNTCYCPKCQK